MIKQGFKNYFKNIWHFFALLGFLTLGIIIALSILIPGEIKSINNIAGSVSKEIGSVTQDQLYAFGNDFFDRIKALDWRSPFEALKQLLNINWISDNMKLSLETAHIPFAESSEKIVAAANVFVKDTTQLLIWSGIVVSITVVVGYIVIRSVIHFSSTKNYNIVRYILSLVLNIALIIGVVLLGATYIPTHPKLLYVIIPSMFIIELLGSLLIAWLTYSKNGVKLFQVLNVKNLIGSLLVWITLLAFTLLIIYVIAKFGNILAAITIAIPLIVITLIIIDANSNSYVAQIANKKATSIE